MKTPPSRTKPHGLMPRNIRPTPYARPPPSPTTYASAVTGTSPGPNRQLITSMAKLEKAIASNLTAARGRERSVTFEPATHGSSDKRGRSPSGDASKNRKAKIASGNECDYPMCRHRSLHWRPDCRLARAHERDGIVSHEKKREGARAGCLKPVRGGGILGSPNPR